MGHGTTSIISSMTVARLTMPPHWSAGRRLQRPQLRRGRGSLRRALFSPDAIRFTGGAAGWSGGRKSQDLRASTWRTGAGQNTSVPD